MAFALAKSLTDDDRHMFINKLKRIIERNQHHRSAERNHPILYLIDNGRVDDDIVTNEVQQRKRAVDIHDFDYELHPPVYFVRMVEHDARYDCHRPEVYDVSHNRKHVAGDQKRQSRRRHVRQNRRQVIFLRKRNHKRNGCGNKKRNRTESHNDAEPNHKQSDRRTYAGKRNAVDRFLT